MGINLIYFKTKAKHQMRFIALALMAVTVEACVKADCDKKAPTKADDGADGKAGDMTCVDTKTVDKDKKETTAKKCELKTKCNTTKKDGDNTLTMTCVDVPPKKDEKKKEEAKGDKAGTCTEENCSKKDDKK